MEMGKFSTFWYFIIIVISFCRREIKILYMFIYIYKKSTIHKKTKILQ